jgi:hypothetical protein
MVVGMMGVVLLAVSVAGALHGPPPKAPSHTAVATNISSTNDTSQTTAQPTAEQNNTPKPSLQKQTGTPQTQTTTNQSNAASPPDSQPSTIGVSLTINKTYRGKVSLPAGSNQCDVLQQALNDGLISNLTMKYISALQSNGVYIIDGLGDANIVWWTYKVNDKSPPVGCSQVAVHQGDSITWEYVKN